MDVNQAITKRRTIRRFKQDPISLDVLKKLIEAARVAPSGANVQPLRYIVATNPELVQQTFPCLKWAGYIAPAGNPPEGEHPTAYIIVLVNTEDNAGAAERDVGAAVENILLAAVEEGIGTCWIGSVDRKRLRGIYKIPEHLLIDSVLALGYPNEQPVMIEMTDSIRYFKDESGTLNVPKRKLEDILEVRD